MKYYLIINDEYYIDFAQINALKDLNTYLKLNLFTMYFNNEKELIEGLKSLKLLPENFEVKNICIARRQNLNSDQFFGITKEIAYSNTLPFMSKTSLINFFNDHRKNPNIISSFANNYIYDFTSKIEAPSINENAKKYFDALRVTLNLLKRMSESPAPNSLLEKEEEQEYRERIAEFLNLTIDSAGKRNYRELIKIAKFAAKCTKELSLDKTNYTSQYEESINQFNHVLKTLVELRCTKQGQLKRAYLKFYEDKDYFHIVKHGVVQEETIFIDSEEDEIDPDHYMFLEIEDFENMSAQTDNPKIKESIEFDIETLKQRKKTGR